VNRGTLTAVGADSLTAVTGSGAQVVVADGGTLALENNASGANRNIVIGGNGAAGRSGALELVSGSSSLSGTVFINGSTRIATRSGAGTLSIGAISANSNGTLTFAADSNPGGTSIVVGGAVSGAGPGTLDIEKLGAGTVSLQGNNTNIGSTNIRQGTLEITGDNLGAGSTLTIGNGRGQLDDNTRARLRVDSTGAVAFGGSTVTLDNGILDIRRGSVNMSGAVITGTTVQPFVAGLSEGRITGTFNIDTATQNPGDFGVQLSIRKGQTNLKSGDPNLGWGDNETWVYTGQVYTDTGFLAFAENIDDRVWVQLNGNVIINNGTWNDPSASGSINLGAAGWYDIEIRMQNGGGGAGAVAGSGWTTSYGFGMSTAPGLTTGDENGGSYSAPVAFTDSNSMPQVLRVAGAGSGKILIGDGGLVTAELVAAGLAGSIEEVRLNGSDTNPARLALVDRVSFQNNAINLLTVQGFATLDIGANQQLTVGAGGMTTSGGLTLTKTGSGSVVVNGAAVLGSAALIDVQAGNVTFSGGLSHLAGTSPPGVSGILVAGGSTVTVENNFTFGGVSTFTKGGAGVMRVNGTNDIADGDSFGLTVVDIQGGSLYLNGAAVNAGFGGTPPIIAVNSGATFGGRGGVRGDVLVFGGGTFSPGDEGGPGAGSNDRSFDIEGSLLLGGDTAEAGSIFSWNLNSLTTADAGVEWDRVNVNAANGSVEVALGSLLDLNFGPGLAPDAGDAFWQQDRTWSKIINVTSGTGVNTSTPQNVFTINNAAWSSLGFFVAQVSGDGQGVDLVWNYTVIPEPASVVLTAAALAGAVLLVRRRRRPAR
jgi:autotransporter-associated beta strand protein